MKFEYEIDDLNKDVTDVQMEFSLQEDPKKHEIIKFDYILDTKQIYVQANKHGWLYLARLCVEMAYCSDKDPGYHIHRREDVSDAMTDEETKVSFFTIK